MLYTEKYDGTKRGVKHTWYNGADWGDISAKGDLKNNNWYYVTYTWNSTKQTLYLNGEQINQRNKPSGSLSLSQDNSRIAGVHYPFNGVIDEVRIYNRALSTAEIRQYYAQGASRHNLVLK